MKTQVERDDCIQCGIETQYLKTDSIYERIGYVEGAGQLCNACFKII